MRLKNPILIFTISLVFASCGQRLTYFQQKDDSKNTFNNVEVAIPEYTRLHVIEAGDILGLKINTPSKELSKEFKPYINNATGIPGLQVQESGEQARISLTIEQAKQLERKLKEVIKKAENEKTLTDFLHN